MPVANPLAGNASRTSSFSDLLETAMKISRGTREHALDHGVDEQALSRFASGACTMYERQEIQYVLSRNEWAMKFVVDLVKSRRKKRNAA